MTLTDNKAPFGRSSALRFKVAGSAVDFPDHMSICGVPC